MAKAAACDRGVVVFSDSFPDNSLFDRKNVQGKEKRGKLVSCFYYSSNQPTVYAISFLTVLDICVGWPGKKRRTHL